MLLLLKSTNADHFLFVPKAHFSFSALMAVVQHRLLRNFIISVKLY